MNDRGRVFGLLTVGAMPRLAAAAVIVVLLWVAFFWVTGTQGAL